jgi:hypothetical protein
VPTIELEADAPPIVRILGVTLRRAAAQAPLAARMDRLHGRVALRSTVDPQAATIHFDRGRITVSHGVDPQADVVISADLNTLGRPGAPKPRVQGALRHLRLALNVGKVLDPPVERGWAGAADEFWAWAQGRRGCPEAIKIVCTDDGTERSYGPPRSPDFEVQGPGWALTAMFTGGDHLGAAIVEGRLQGVGELPVVSEFVGLVTARMLGED